MEFVLGLMIGALLGLGLGVLVASSAQQQREAERLARLERWRRSSGDGSRS